MLLRAPIVAIDRLAHWRSALHHVGCLRRHCGSAVIRPHLRLRGHCLGAACHGGTGAEYVCECRVPCSPRLAIWRARKLPPCSLFGAQSVLGSLAHSQTSINAGRLFGGVCCVIGRAKHNAARNEGVRLVAQGVNQDTAGLQDTITSDYVWMCAGVGGVKRRQTAGVDDRPARRGACVKSVGRLR
jgi:hypothetical protein